MKRDYKTAFIATVLILILFIFNYIGFIESYVGFLYHNIIRPLSIQNLPEPLYLIISILIVNIPTMAGGAAWSIYRWKIRQDSIAEADKNPLDNIEGARKTLKSPLSI
jgi:hypothetical protein